MLDMLLLKLVDSEVVLDVCVSDVTVVLLVVREVLLLVVLDPVLL